MLLERTRRVWTAKNKTQRWHSSPHSYFGTWSLNIDTGALSQCALKGNVNAYSKDAFFMDYWRMTFEIKMLCVSERSNHKSLHSTWQMMEKNLCGWRFDQWIKPLNLVIHLYWMHNVLTEWKLVSFYGMLYCINAGMLMTSINKGHFHLFRSNSQSKCHLFCICNQ